jgi:shikimate dehydrogenase
MLHILRAGVMGWPVGHSLSPRLHGFWLAELGIGGTYEAIPVEPENFAAELKDLAQKGFRGVNVTVPHKQAALAAVDTADGPARRIGAVNTIVVEDDGTLTGSNTDGFGFIENLCAGLDNWSAAAGPAVMIGAGGAARAIAAALIDGGAPELRLVNRTLSKAAAIARDIGGPIEAFPWQDRSQVLEGAALLVNATTLGMTGGRPLGLDLTALPTEALVTDIVYTPLATPLLKDAMARGNPTRDGLGMLLHQARPGFAAWFGVEPRVTEALRAHVLEGVS